MRQPVRPSAVAPHKTGPRLRVRPSAKVVGATRRVSIMREVVVHQHATHRHAMRHRTVIEVDDIPAHGVRTRATARPARNRDRTGSGHSSTRSQWTVQYLAPGPIAISTIYSLAASSGGALRKCRGQADEATEVPWRDGCRANRRGRRISGRRSSAAAMVRRAPIRIHHRSGY